MYTNTMVCAGGNHFEFERQRKVILTEKHETSNHAKKSVIGQTTQPAQHDKPVPI